MSQEDSSPFEIFCEKNILLFLEKDPAINIYSALANAYNLSCITVDRETFVVKIFP